MAQVYFDPAVGGNGTTVTDDANPTTGLANGGHRTRFVPALAQVVAVADYVADAAATAVVSAGYKGDYSPTTSYQVGDGVTYNGLRYSAKTPNTGVTPVHGANWEQSPLPAFRGVYSPTATYLVGQSVTYQGATFTANTVNTGVTPVNGANWTISYTAGYMGEYAAGTTYYTGQSVTYQGDLFTAKKTNLGITPVNGADWQIEILTSKIVAVAALNLDPNEGNYFTKTINGNSTFTFGTPPAGRAYAMTLELTHTSGTVNFPGSVVWQQNTPPTLTTGRVHLFTFVTSNGGTTWRGSYQLNFTS